MLISSRVGVLSILFALSALGCTRTREVTWKVNFATEVLKDRAAVLETSIVESGCTGVTSLYFETVKIGAKATPPPSLPKGLYGLRHRARDANCVWYAAGCQNVVFPLDTDNTTVTLLPTEEEGACTANECVNAECVVTPIDTSQDGGIHVTDASMQPQVNFCTRVSAPPRVLYTFRKPNADGSIDDESPALPSPRLIPDPSRASGVVYVSDGVQLTNGRLEASLEDSQSFGQALVGAGSFSAEIWAKPTNPSTTTWERIVYYGYDSVGFALVEKDGVNVAGWLRTTATYSNGQVATGGMPSELLAPLPKDIFTHVVMVYDHASGKASIFVNGSIATSFDHAVNGLPASLNNWVIQDNRFVLGDIVNSKGDQRVWNGTLSKVAIYDRALSVEEISALFQAGKDVGC